MSDNNSVGNISLSNVLHLCKLRPGWLLDSFWYIFNFK